MSHVRMKLTGAALAIAIAVSFLAWAGIRDGWVYFLQVDQFVQDDSYHDQRVRLHGTVSNDNFLIDRGLLTAEFDLLGQTQQQRISYGGVVPDLFKRDQDVVVEGRLDEAGIFQADTLMTKCASKYETDQGEAPHEDPRTGEDES